MLSNDAKKGARVLLPIFLWFFLVCCPVVALDWPEQVEIGSLLVLDGPEGVACAWGISGTDIDGDAYDPVWREFRGAVAVETRYGGLLTIELQTSAKRGLSEIKWCIAVGEGDEPGPDPPPPSPTKLFAVLVFEESDRDDYTAEQIIAIESEAIRDYMQGKEFLLRVVDKDVKEEDGEPPQEIRSFLKRAEGKDLPRIIIADENAHIFFEGDVVDEQSLLSKLKSLGGE